LPYMEKNHTFAPSKGVSSRQGVVALGQNKGENLVEQ
jgi:hypothetical protein